MNMKHARLGLGVAALAALGACTDTQMAHFAAIGSSGRVTCYSGGKMIYDDFSTGKIQNAEGSDGYEFKSVTTKRLSQVSGECVIDYGASPGNGWSAILPGQAAPSAPVVPVQ